MSLQEAHRAVRDAVSSPASVTTQAGAGGAVLFWGLHLGDIAVVISTLASVIGVSVQVWMAIRKARQDRKSRDDD